MYIHVTSRCNMSCAHCCFSANGKGEDMDPDMFRKILEKWSETINKYNQYIVIGGGEPTLHPNFWKLVLLAQAAGYPWLATNGKNTEVALLLAQMARYGHLGAVLSQDAWHDPIEKCVVDAFKKDLEPTTCDAWVEWSNKKDSRDRRGIRTVVAPILGGRARDLFKTREGCPCPGIHFWPDGRLVACGCDDSPTLGSIDSGVTEIQYKYYDIFRGCYKEPSAAFVDSSVGETNEYTVAS